MADFNDDFSVNNFATNYDNVNSGLTTDTGKAKGINTGTTNQSTVKTSVFNFSDDHEATVTISTAGSGDVCGPTVRHAGTTADCYMLYIDTVNTSSKRLSKVVSGVRTTLVGAANATVANGDIVTLRAIGSTISWYKNGVLQETITGQTDHTTGQPGLFYNFGNSNAARLDDFSASNVVADVGFREYFITG
jgi:hypothetical protein